MQDPIYCLVLLDWPCAKGEIWAAWSQAILSGAGVLVAALLPLFLSWRKQTTGIRRVVEAIRVAEHHATRATDLKTVIHQMQIIDAEIRFWEAIQATFADLSPQSIPHPNLLQHMVVVRAAADRQLETLNNIRKCKGVVHYHRDQLIMTQLVMKDALASTESLCGRRWHHALRTGATRALRRLRLH